MKKLTLASVLGVFVSITACNEKASQPEPEAVFTYPTTEKQDVVDVYFDEKVADPYRCCLLYTSPSPRD